MLPRLQWSEFVASARAGAKLALIRVAAAKPTWSEPAAIDWSKNRVRDPDESRGVDWHLGDYHSRRVYNNKTNSKLFERGAARSFSLLGDEVDREGVFCLASPNRSIWEGRPPGEPAYYPPDPVRRPPPVVSWISPEIVPEGKARLVIDGFRSAVEKVYGVQWWHYWKGELSRAKHYAKFVACGEALADHSVPAEHWAIWRLKWFAANVKAFSTKPPPVWMVMNAKTVSERAGWFRKDYPLPVPVTVFDPIVYEQILRNREAMFAWRGVAAAHRQPTFPKWYADKRQAEIDEGLRNPHDFWPRRARA